MKKRLEELMAEGLILSYVLHRSVAIVNWRDQLGLCQYPNLRLLNRAADEIRKTPRLNSNICA